MFPTWYGIIGDAMLKNRISFGMIPCFQAILMALAVGCLAWDCIHSCSGSHALGVAGALLGGIGVAGILAAGRHSARQIASIQAVLGRIAGGDMSARTKVGSVVAEFEAISRAVNGLGESNSSLVTELRDGASALEREIVEFHKAFDRIRGQASRSREATSMVAAAMQELGAGVGTIGRDTVAVEGAASETCAMARKLEDMASSTAQAVDRQFRSMREAEARMEDVLSSTRDLEKRAHEISGAASSITDVAKRLRLLALNASIEAAKAGESGRGFSIVAQEVKALADQVGGMADRIQSQVAAVNEGTSKVSADMTVSVQSVESMKEDGRHSVDAASTQSKLSQESVAKLEDTSRNIGEISRTLEESRGALGEIERNSVELDARAGATVAALSGLENSLVDLDRLARSFSISVKEFRLREPFFPWTDGLSVGVPRMDDQHKVLLRLINRVADLGESGATGGAIRTILDQLVEYTRFHFSEEEKLMAAYGYPGVAGHHAIHEKFVGEVQEMVRKLGDGEAFDARSLLDVLRNWLVEHIQGADKRYGEHVSRGISGTLP